MKIDSSTVGMESARSYTSTSKTVSKFTIREYQGSLTNENNLLNTNTSDNKDRTAEDKEQKVETNANTSTIQELQTRLQNRVNNVNMRSSAEQSALTIQQETINYIFMLLFSDYKDRFFEKLSGNCGALASNVTSLQQDSGAGQITGIDASSDLFVGANIRYKVLSLSTEHFYEEHESTSFSTTGKVCTADGREIAFNVNVGMSRSFMEHTGVTATLASYAMYDPLVINLENDVAEVADQTIYFDIDSDGVEDEITDLAAGSGYLALDKNGDGIINNGSELFGADNGDGFADLALYDSDGNGWIDENDEIWNKLRIWTQNARGEMELYALKDKGLGAICLQNVDTDFQKTATDGTPQANIRKTGIFLYENGMAGTVQHLDVARYYKEA